MSAERPARRSGFDESLKLGAEEGTADMIIPRFVVGARLAVLRGDRAAAAEHLDHAADIAERLSTPRLRASVENERVVLGLPTRRVAHPPVEFSRRQRPEDGLGEITANWMKRGQFGYSSSTLGPEQDDLACRWAQEWVDRLTGRGRHRAMLRAQRLLAECLSAAGRTAEAKQLLGSVLARCADLGMVRFPIDGGERLVSLIAEVRNIQATGRSDMPQLAMSFLDRILVAAGQGRKGMDEGDETSTA